LQTIQDFAIASRKDFIDGWQIHEWGVTSNCFDSMFTKWLMPRKNIDLGWFIARTSL
jgi:hypothetical protein